MVVQPDSPNSSTTTPAVDGGLQAAYAQIYERLGRLEAALQRTEGFVAEKPWDQSAIAFKRLERIDETLRSMQRSIDESTLPEMCVNIERQIVQARLVLDRTAAEVSRQSLRDLCEDIEARLGRTEDTLRRTENMVAGWRRDFSEAITARSAEASEAAPSLWPPRFATPAIAAVLTVAIVALIWATRGISPTTTTRIERSTVPSAIPASVQMVSAPTSVPVSVPLRETPATASIADGGSSTRVNATPTSARQAPRPRRAAAPASRTQFVGTLSITSVPSGATVSINGKEAGVTPLRLPRLRAGSMAVQIAQDGFERWSAAVRVPADQLTQVTAKLRPVAQ